MEQEIQRIWILVSELSEQLVQNKCVAAELRTQIQALKEQAETQSKSTILRRYNVDIGNELFDSEIERSAVAMIIENQTLLQENKQLNALMTDYEQTLETVMTKFRQHAQAATEKESNLVRYYNTLLLSGDSPHPTQTYDLFTLKQALERLSSLVRLAMMSESGDDPQGAAGLLQQTETLEVLPTGEMETEIEALGRALSKVEAREQDDDDPGVDWIAEREAEIARLEKENMELRRELGILEDPEEKDSDKSSYGQRHNRTTSIPFGAGFTTSPNVPSPQPSPLSSNPYSPNYSGPQGYNPQVGYNQPERRIGMPNRPGLVAPAPPQISPRNTFAEGNMGARPGPTFSNYFRGAPPSRERLDLNGGQSTLL